LRTEIHGRLRERPWLTADEIARTIGREVSPAGVRRVLRQMEHDGEASSRARLRTDGSGRTAAEWSAT
jgi:predicted ArsR family transcriptional regulator